MGSIVDEHILKLENIFKDVHHINDAISLYEKAIRDITDLDNITIFITQNNNFYSPQFDKSFAINNRVNGIVSECYFTKRVHTIKDVTCSFLYNKDIDNILNIDIKNITVIPILNSNNNVISIIEIIFDDKDYLDDVIKFIDGIKDIIISLYEVPDVLEYSPKILLVDDSFIMLKFLSSIIKKYDVDIITATSALEGIEKFKYENVDMIFMDDIMVGMSGHEAISIIRDIEIEKKIDPIPIFGITSDTTKDAKNRLIGSGANLVFYKPIEKDSIIEAMRLFMIIK